MTFTIMITTRNRCDELELTCAKLRQLAPPPQEVLICADGCRDHTTEMLRGKFKEFRVLENPVAKGSVSSRDRLLRAAGGDIVVSLDDDSFPLRSDFLDRLGAVFEQHPEAGVVVFPELRAGGTSAAPDKTQHSPGHYVSSYANCAAAMRRVLYLRLPGFASWFEHMYEEPDYALQCYSSGAAVWFEPSLVIAHRQSVVNRQLLRRHHLNARNELWSVWLRCPWPWLAVISAYRIVRQFLCACSRGVNWALHEPAWWAAAVTGVRKCWQQRHPVPWAIYYQWMRLARKPIYSMGELRRKFSVTGLHGPTGKGKTHAQALRRQDEQAGGNFLKAL